MARPAHTLIEFSGVFGTAAAPYEEWSYAFRCAGQVDPGDLATIVLAAETAWGVEIANIMPSDVSLTRTRVANIEAGTVDAPGGLIATNADGSYQLEDEFGDTPGSSAAGGFPTQCAIAVSLNTARPGPTGKGRIFSPMVAGALPADRQLPIGTAQAVADAYRDLVSTLNSIGLLGPVSVVSSKGYTSPVTSLRVGRVVDTMRSRRNRRDEGYVTASF